MKHVYLLWERHDLEGQRILLDIYSSQTKAEKAKRAWEEQRASDDTAIYTVQKREVK